MAKNIALTFKKIWNRVKNFKLAYLDFNLLLFLLILVVFGWIMIYSASSYVAFRDHSGQADYFFVRQVAISIGGLIFMFIVAVLPIDWLNNKIMALIAYFVGVGFIFLTIPFGKSSHGATRWVYIPGVPFGIQPVEIAKTCLIVVMAFYIVYLGKQVNSILGFAKMVAIPMPICLLVYILTDNLSSALIIVIIIAAMIFIATRYYLFYGAVVAVVGLIATGIVYYCTHNDVTQTGRFRLVRISVWLHPELSSDTTSHQTLQALYAIGNGGFWGKGLGQSVQKITKLPEPQNDMIFAVICEELGIVGAVAMILIFLMLLWRIYLIARETEDKFRYMIVVGVMAHIAIQLVLNIAVATNSIPNTGVSLPFISYGGSSAFMLLAEMGLVFNIDIKNKLGE